MDFTKFDDLLMGILQHYEQVEPFLDAIFSFLARRTDFFLVMHNRDDKVGFAPGVAEKMVLKVWTFHLTATWLNLQQIFHKTKILKNNELPCMRKIC